MSVPTTDPGQAMLTELRCTLGHRFAAFDGALVSTALVVSEGAASATEHGGVVRFGALARDARPARRYGPLLLTDTWLCMRDVEQLAAQAAAGVATIGGVQLSGIVTSHHANHHVDVRDVGELPGWALRWHWSPPTQSTLSSSQRAVAFGVPPFTTRQAAATSWLFPKGGPELGQHYAAHAWILWVPDDRARFGAISWVDDVLDVRVDTPLPLARLQVQVLFGDRDEAEGTVHPLEAKNVTISMLHKPPRAHVLVVLDDGQLLAATPAHRNQSVARDEAPEAFDVVGDIAAGERDEVEFKPWVRPHDAKERELLRTVVAFANTRGGRLYVGVQDDGAPQSGSALAAMLKARPENAIQRAVERLRELIVESIAPTPAFDIALHRYGGEEVLCVDVQFGADEPREPYHLLDTNEVFVRRGATTRRPTPREQRELWSEPGEVGRSLFSSLEEM